MSKARIIQVSKIKVTRFYLEGFMLEKHANLSINELPRYYYVSAGRLTPVGEPAQIEYIERKLFQLLANQSKQTQANDEQDDKERGC